jgi:hypothetical protein
MEADPVAGTFALVFEVLVSELFELQSNFRRRQRSGLVQGGLHLRTPLLRKQRDQVILEFQPP